MYTLYRTTNVNNGKIYVGIHKTENPHDDYLGSGKLLKLAIRKYGRESFTKEILAEYSTLENAREAERAMVDSDFVSSTENYNLAVGGGLGGKDLNGLTFAGNKHSPAARKKISLSARSRTHTPETRKKLRDNAWAKSNPEAHREAARRGGQKPKTIEHRQALSRSLKEWYKTNPERKRDTSMSSARRVVKCPHCDKEGTLNNMTRWHFDNCKKINGE